MVQIIIQDSNPPGRGGCRTRRGGRRGGRATRSRHRGGRGGRSRHGHWGHVIQHEVYSGRNL